MLTWPIQHLLSNSFNTVFMRCVKCRYRVCETNTKHFQLDHSAKCAYTFKKYVKSSFENKKIQTKLDANDFFLTKR